MKKQAAGASLQEQFDAYKEAAWIYFDPNGYFTSKFNLPVLLSNGRDDKAELGGSLRKKINQYQQDKVFETCFKDMPISDALYAHAIKLYKKYEQEPSKPETGDSVTGNKPYALLMMKQYVSQKLDEAKENLGHSDSVRITVEEINGISSPDQANELLTRLSLAWQPGRPGK